MFYAHIILAKKGPLARVWLAAHWDKKITKAHVFETNIEKSVEGIMQPKVKLALRTSGHLLLGVVRIYSRKAKYLLADCNEAFVKIKMAFRPGMVDLPEGHREANVNAITLPEVFHDFDTALPELNDIDIEAQFSINQSRADEITMREDYGSLSLSLQDDGFGDIGFEGDTPDLMRGSLESNMNDQLFEDDVIQMDTEAIEPCARLNEGEMSHSRLGDDGFGDEFGQPALFEDDLFGEPHLGTNANQAEDHGTAMQQQSDDDMDHFDNDAPSPASSHHDSLASVHGREDEIRGKETSQNEDRENVALDQPTLLQNEDESFALAPIDASAYKGLTKTKRKRKLIVDEIKNIPGDEMKLQMANTSDIVTTLDLAPPTKRVMYWKETGGVEKLFSLPSRPIPARALIANYHRHLISHITQLEDFSFLGPADLLALDNIQNENEPQIINNKRGRKRKLELLPLAQQTNAPNVGDTTSNSLAAPETAREQEAAALSHISLDIAGNAQNSAALHTDATIFDGIHGVAPLSISDINGIANLSSLNDIPLELGHMHGGDATDDFGHDDIHPGQISPHHPGIESIESLPNLPPDQVSSLLNESAGIAGNMHSRLDDRSAELAAEWDNYELAQTGVIQNTSEEQMENETNEQFEERVLNKRAAQLFLAVRTRMVKHDRLLLSELTLRNTRKMAAQKFYSLLVLKKFRALEISQSAPYTDIAITRGPLFENPKL